jgi:hypothetical protein
MLLGTSRLHTLLAMSFGVSLLATARNVSPRHSAFVLESLSWFLIVLAALGLSRLAARAFRSYGIERQAARVAAGLLDPCCLPPEAAPAVRDRAIALLYAELRELATKKSASPPRDFEGRLSRLRSLQEEEAAEMRERASASFPLKPGEGRRVLQEARILLARYENPSTPDSPISHQTRP